MSLSLKASAEKEVVGVIQLTYFIVDPFLLRRLMYPSCLVIPAIVGTGTACSIRFSSVFPRKASSEGILSTDGFKRTLIFFGVACLIRIHC